VGEGGQTKNGVAGRGEEMSCAMQLNRRVEGMRHKERKGFLGLHLHRLRQLPAAAEIGVVSILSESRGT
jgi:hypothetical protein